ARVLHVAGDDPGLPRPPGSADRLQPDGRGGVDRDLRASFHPRQETLPPPDDVTCCPDFNDNGQCDDKESAANTLNMEDVAIEPVEGKPPGILCGDEPLRIEVRLRNNGLKRAHRSG